MVSESARQMSAHGKEDENRRQSKTFTKGHAALNDEPRCQNTEKESWKNPTLF